MPEISLTGSNFIAGSESLLSDTKLFAKAAVSGETLEPGFSVASPAEIAAAGAAAAEAKGPYAALPVEQRAKFLEAIATEIEALGDALLERASLESGLPLARLTGERGRTCGQLRMFASLIREGSWVDARIEPALPDRKPLPRPDLRRMLVPLGPVAVFGASNFPLAFSVAGGDSSSAWAAGCPVIVKAHPAHPGTSEMVARSVIAAAELCGIPAGVFSMLHGEAETGQALAQLPEVSAIGFTGSLKAGRALFDLAAARPTPIPVYAEMGSVNPVFVLPAAIEARGAAIAKGYGESLVLGVGQFCTNPGLFIAIEGDGLDRLLSGVIDVLEAVVPGTMLTSGIASRYSAGVAERAAHSSLEAIFVGDRPTSPSLFRVSASSFLADPELSEELFGPSGIVVVCQDESELLEVARKLAGQLTTTVHMDDADSDLASELLPLLVAASGRVIANAYPTGVEVGSAMQHGGPYPATTDSRTTSVGTAAILRFVRPVAFQNMPQAFLPAELQDGNPRGIWRTVEGTFTRS